MTSRASAPPGAPPFALARRVAGVPPGWAGSLAVAGLAVVVAVVVVMEARPGSTLADVAGSWGQALGEIAGAVACGMTAAAFQGRGRLTWALFAAGLGIWALTDVAAGAIQIAGMEIGQPGPLDIPWLFFYVPMLAGTLLLYGRLRPERNWQGVIDAALVSGGVALFGWVLLIAPSADGSIGVLGNVVNLMYPIFDLICLGALGWVIARHLQNAPGWLWLLACAFGLALVADVVYLTAFLHGIVLAEGLSAAAYAASGFLWAQAAIAVRRHGQRPISTTRSAPPLWGEAIPIASGLSVVTLLAVSHGVVGLAATAGVALVGVRVVVAYHTNRGLIRDREHQERELELLASEQAALRRVAEAVAAETAPMDIFALVAAEVTRLFSADAGLVWRFDGESAESVGSFGQDVPPPGVTMTLDGAGAVASLVARGRTSRASYGLDRGGGDQTRHSIAAPVIVGGTLWGCVHIAVTIAGEVSHFDAAAEARLERFAELVGLALANADGRVALEERASTDALTGLTNRRRFQERLGAEWETARRADRTLALIMIDIDHFKRINDTHGHPVGDRVIVELAARLAHTARSSDVVSRIGGDEFAWLLPNVTPDEALAAAERARRFVRSTPFEGVGTVTASFGVCDSRQSTGPGELELLADDALYTAKRAGRDRIWRRAEDPALPAVIPTTQVIAGRQLQTATIQNLACAVDDKDPATRRHSGRVADMAVQVATALGWDHARTAELRDAALVHDVGKVAIPDAILSKPGRLTPAEYEVVKAHTTMGAAIASEVLSEDQTTWVRHHHERYDGSGYPSALAGAAIPDGARIIAVVDALDVMLTPRPYAEARTPAEAIEEVVRCAGTQFDPEVVAAIERLVEAGALMGLLAARAV